MVKVNNDKIQEIENFITILETKILMDNDIRQSFCMISKKILIIKQILSVNNQRDFLDSMIYSLLMGIKILISDHFKQEQYDLYIRIFIEHGFKMLTDKDRNSRITVDQIREEILKQYNSSNLKKEIKSKIDTLYNFYSDCSGSLHGGARKLDNVGLYFNDLYIENKIEVTKLKKQVEQLKKILDNIIYFIILLKPDMILEAFLNKMFELEYLLSEKQYKMIKSMIH